MTLGVATGGMDAVQLNYSADFLGPNRLSDRGMMEQVLENMDSVSQSRCRRRLPQERRGFAADCWRWRVKPLRNSRLHGDTGRRHGHGVIHNTFTGKGTSTPILMPNAEREDECDSGDPEGLQPLSV